MRNIFPLFICIEIILLVKLCSKERTIIPNNSDMKSFIKKISLAALVLCVFVFITSSIYAQDNSNGNTTANPNQCKNLEKHLEMYGTYNQIIQKQNKYALFENTVAYIEVIMVPMLVRAPLTSGTFTLEIYLEHYGVTTFTDAGVPALTYTVLVYDRALPQCPTIDSIEA